MSKSLHLPARTWKVSGEVLAGSRQVRGVEPRACVSQERAPLWAWRAEAAGWGGDELPGDGTCARLRRRSPLEDLVQPGEPGPRLNHRK